jgi:hypothetical protein
MKAAFLSSSLISAKGSAGPATRSQPPQEILARKSVPPREKRAATRDVKTVAPMASPKATASATAPKTAPSPIADYSMKALRKQSDQLRKDNLGRVRMSLRMDPEEHLTLKLLCAYSHKSAQEIMEDALREYVDNHADEFLPLDCDCIRDRLLK